MSMVLQFSASNALSILLIFAPVIRLPVTSGAILSTIGIRRALHAASFNFLDFNAFAMLFVSAPFVFCFLAKRANIVGALRVRFAPAATLVFRFDGAIPDAFSCFCNSYCALAISALSAPFVVPFMTQWTIAATIAIT